VRVAVWGKRAEGQLVNYLKKGQQVFVSGELSQQEYQGSDGSTKTALELNAYVLDLVGKRSDNPLAAQSNNAASAEQNDNFADFGGDEIPF
jgi:single-strand DNA-binding protein